MSSPRCSGVLYTPGKAPQGRNSRARPPGGPMRPGGHPMEDGEPGTGVREGRAQPHGSQATAEGAFSAGAGEERIWGQHVRRGLEGVSHPCRGEAGAARALSLRRDGGSWALARVTSSQPCTTSRPPRAPRRTGRGRGAGAQPGKEEGSLH